MRILLAVLYILGTNLSLEAEGAGNASERDLEQSIDQVIGIFSDDVVTDADHQFVLSVPKEVIPLLIRRLERERESPTKYSGAFDLLANKLKQFEGEIPNDVRQAAINLMVKTCESATNETALPYLSGFRGLKDPKIAEMAGRMKSRPDSNVRQAAAKLLESTDDAPPLNPVPASSAAPARTIVTPTPSTSVPTATPTPSNPAAVVVESPAPVVERKAPVWPWLVGILVPCRDCRGCGEATRMIRRLAVE